MILGDKNYCDSCLQTIAEHGEAQQHFQAFKHELTDPKHVCLNCGQYASELEELGFEEVYEVDEGDQVPY